jgi:thiol-disulfide isomerase/thioredoxin
MKKLLMLFFSINWFCSPMVFSQNKIVLHGNIKNPIADTIHLNNIWGDECKSKIDPKGNFAFVFTPKSSDSFYNFQYGDIIIPTYLSFNDTLIMNFDYNDVNSSIEYTGKKEESIFNQSLFNLSKGKSAPDFTLIDNNGKNVSLSDFKGKYIFIDVWASYCGGCIKEIPYYEKLKEKYKNNNIVFISISGDKDKDRWLKTIKKKGMTGIQLINQEFKADFSNKYLNYGSPRYILLDREQKMIYAVAPKPSNVDEILRKLKGI